MRRVKGRSSRKIQQEFPAIRKRYWGCHFWARGYFSTTSGNITDDVILQYLEQHVAQPTAVSRQWFGEGIAKNSTRDRALQRRIRRRRGAFHCDRIPAGL